jgi:hypothetical protein
MQVANDERSLQERECQIVSAFGVEREERGPHRPRVETHS